MSKRALVVDLTTSEYEKILKHAKDSYPHECCGALLGLAKTDGANKKVTRARPLTNTNKERAKDRYEIDPRELLTVEKEARGASLEVVGIYHSHPDHPARPSQFDRDRGWPDYSYIIVAVEGGEKTLVKSWSFIEEDDPFNEEELNIVD